MNWRKMKMTTEADDGVRRYFVFRDLDGKVKVRSWARYSIDLQEVLAWADDIQEAHRLARGVRADVDAAK